MATGKHWRYTVLGRGVFPLDMLRYDSAWPRDSADVGRITESLRQRPGANPRQDWKIDLLSTREPSEGRWASFGWTVTDIEKWSV